MKDAITFTITHTISSCLECPHMSKTMDGLTCGKLEKDKGAYAGLVITNQFEIAKECPYKQ